MIVKTDPLHDTTLPEGRRGVCVRCWNEQHRTGGAPYDAIRDGPESKASEADRLVRTQHDQVRCAASRVAEPRLPSGPVECEPSLERSMLLRAHAVPPGRHPFTASPTVRRVLDGVHHDELCSALNTHGESLLKGCRGR